MINWQYWRKRPPIQVVEARLCRPHPNKLVVPHSRLPPHAHLMQKQRCKFVAKWDWNKLHNQQSVASSSLLLQLFLSLIDFISENIQWNHWIAQCHCYCHRKVLFPKLEKKDWEHVPQIQDVMLPVTVLTTLTLLWTILSSKIQIKYSYVTGFLLK